MISKNKQEQNAENIKELLEELMRLYVALDRKQLIQRKILENFINQIKLKNTTFQNIMKTLKIMMDNAKTRDTIAVLAEVFNIVTKHYQEKL